MRGKVTANAYSGGRGAWNGELWGETSPRSEDDSFSPLCSFLLSVRFTEMFCDFIDKI